MNSTLHFWWLLSYPEKNNHMWGWNNESLNSSDYFLPLCQWLKAKKTLVISSSDVPDNLAIINYLKAWARSQCILLRSVKLSSWSWDLETISHNLSRNILWQMTFHLQISVYVAFLANFLRSKQNIHFRVKPSLRAWFVWCNPAQYI